MGMTEHALERVKEESLRGFESRADQEERQRQAAALARLSRRVC